MKFKTILFLGILLIASFNLSFNKNEIIKKNKTEAIIGSYFVLNFKDSLKSGLRLLENEPKTNNNLFKFDFLDSGIIKITDLDKTPRCGNGLLYITNAEWKKIKKNSFEININGGNNLESTFEFKATYNLEINADFKYLRLIKIIKNKTKSVFTYNKKTKQKLKAR